MRNVTVFQRRICSRTLLGNSRGGSLLPSASADACYIDDVVRSSGEIVTPAIEGTKNVMAAAKRAGVKRVVLTSSVFALGNFMHPDPPVNGTIYTEEDWNTQASKSARRSNYLMRARNP